MSEIRLRIRWSGGNTLHSVLSSLTFRQLQKEIESKTSIPVAYQDLRKGYPPKPFTLPASSPLSQGDLATGETIIVEKRETPLPLSEVMDSLQMFRRVIPADNSCLFNSVAYALVSRSKHEGMFLREVVANVVEEDLEGYPAEVLGRSNEDYAKWARMDSSWGGDVELSILAKYYGVCVAAVSIKDARIDFFGQEAGYQKVIYVLYDGIHYDVLVKNISESSSESSDLTVFDLEDLETRSQAVSYAAALKSQRKFTDTQKFSLKCMICQSGLTGESEARAHAAETGHSNFCEY